MPQMQSDDDFKKTTSARLGVIEGQLQQLHTAFVRNDLGAPDHDGHRRDHVARIKQAEEFEGYKQAATKKIISVLLGVLLTAAGTGIVHLVLEKMGGS